MLNGLTFEILNEISRNDHIKTVTKYRDNRFRIDWVINEKLNLMTSQGQ